MSHETIYRSLYVQARGVLKKLLLHLRSGGQSAARGKRQPHRHFGRTPLTLCDVRQAPQQRLPDRCQRPHQAGAPAPSELYKSLTWDRGSEFAEHQRFTLATDIAVYFCDRQSPWQRGSSENTNRLLCQYFSKGADLAPQLASSAQSPRRKPKASA